MSTITKILIVLLSLFSIFLCGMMVSFVGSAENYKSLYTTEKLNSQVLLSEAENLKIQFKEQAQKTSELETKLRQEMATLQERNNQLAASLRNAERAGQEFESRAESWKGVMTGFDASVRSMLESLKLTQGELEKARAQNVKDQRDLNQITTDLYEKIVELQRLEADRRRLLEQKTELEKQMVRGAAAIAQPVTVVPDNAQPAGPAAVASDIKGLIKEIDQSLVTLSIGSADGVEKGMVFHVTRGDEFLCNVVVTSVDIEKSAGILEMVQQTPKIGDTVTTKL